MPTVQTVPWKSFSAARACGRRVATARRRRRWVPLRGGSVGELTMTPVPQPLLPRAAQQATGATSGAAISRPMARRHFPEGLKRHYKGKTARRPMRPGRLRRARTFHLLRCFERWHPQPGAHGTTDVALRHQARGSAMPGDRCPGATCQERERWHEPGCLRGAFY